MYDDFYLDDRPSICVVCGMNDETMLTKHHIIPYMFRKHFPEYLKNHSSYDVVVMCEEHHSNYEQEATKLKKILYKKYNIASENNLKLKKLSKTLLNVKLDIPKSRIIEIQNEIEKITGLEFDNITTYQLQCWSNNIDLGKEVVKNITDFQSFIEMWRQHFLDYAKPKFMSKHWKVKKSYFKNEIK